MGVAQGVIDPDGGLVAVGRIPDGFGGSGVPGIEETVRVGGVLAVQVRDGRDRSRGLGRRGEGAQAYILQGSHVVAGVVQGPAPGNVPFRVDEEAVRVEPELTGPGEVFGLRVLGGHDEEAVTADGQIGGR